MPNIDQDLIEMMMQLEIIMRREMMGRFHRDRVSMNPHRGQGRIMSILKLKPEISQKGLSFMLDMSKQGLAELLSKLESAGYIVRTPSAEDGRAMIIKLTESGEKVAQEMDMEEDNSVSMFSCLSDEEKKNLKEYLTKIIEQTRKNMPAPRYNRHRRMNGSFYSND